MTLAAAAGSAIAAGVLVAWLLAADTGLDTHGLLALWSAAAFLAAAALIHSVVLGRGS